MLRLLGAILGNAIALLATTVVPGIVFTGSLGQLVLGGIIFGLFNLIVRPIAVLLSLPALILTLGLFYFVINVLMLALAEWIAPDFSIDGFWTYVGATIVVSIVNWAMYAIYGKFEGSKSGQYAS